MPVSAAVLLLLPPQGNKALLLLRRLHSLLGQLPHSGEARQLHRLHGLQLQPEAAATTAGGWLHPSSNLDSLVLDQNLLRSGLRYSS